MGTLPNVHTVVRRIACSLGGIEDGRTHLKSFYKEFLFYKLLNQRQKPADRHSQVLSESQIQEKYTCLWLSVMRPIGVCMSMH